MGIWLIPESCISCRVIWARAFRDEGSLGLISRCYHKQSLQGSFGDIYDKNR